MNQGLQQVYNVLPVGLRSVVATIYGFRLEYLRYSRDTEDLVAAALDREHWTSERLKSWQEERLQLVLQRAATRVPYYRKFWEERRLKGDRASWRRLENWPILEKEEVRRDTKAFLADDCDLRRLIRDHTSGTTGKPLDIYCSKDTARKWYALFEARARRWYGVSRNDRWAILGGQMVTPVSQRRPPFWVWNAALNQLYMSAYHLAPDLVPHYLKAIEKYHITYLLGYTSALYALAQEILRAKRSCGQLAVVITNAEPLFDHQRELISEAFQCPVRETYGLAETVFAAGECEQGRLHAWPESGVCEVIQDGLPVAAGMAGELVCTGLMNADMPLIRYRTGDRGALAAPQTPCECGRGLPVIDSIEGRADDVLLTRDGRRIGRLDPVFKSSLSIREAQIVQEAIDCVRLIFVPAPEYTAADGQAMVSRLRDRMGKIEVVLEPVSEIPRTANGKFRAVICNLPKMMSQSAISVAPTESQLQTQLHA